MDLRGVGYVRVSTEEQAREGVSLDAQRARLAAWFASHEIAPEAYQTHADEGLSGKHADNRPGLQAALEAACASRCALVVYSISRMARSVKDTLAIAERLHKAGADLVSLTESIDTTSATGKMLFRLMAVLAEFERDLISERTKSGLAYKRSKGEVYGPIPRGFKAIEDGRLVEDADEVADIAYIRELHGQGFGSRHISRLMSGRKGRRNWAESTVRRILARAS